MNYDIKKVQTDHEIKCIAECAEITWHDTFDNILPEGQTEYMIEQFQSFDAIKNAINNGYIYFAAYCNKTIPYIRDESESIAGYCGIKPDGEKLFISKIYINPKYQRNGIATQFFTKLKNDYSDKFRSFYLTVNVNNEKAILTYKKWGFKIIKTSVTDIGKGYIMDDFIMEYRTK